MLRWRLSLGTLIIAALAGLCWLDSRAEVAGIWLLPVLVLLAMLATQEVLRLARSGGLQPLGWAVYLGNLLVVLGQWIPSVGSQAARWLGFPGASAQRCAELAGVAPLWTLAVGVLLIFVGEMRRYEKPGGVLANLAVAVFALVYVGVMLAFAVQIRVMWGLGAMAAWIIAVKMGDTGAYTVGRMIGRHKMAPAISPGKTIEGAFGALLFSCLGAWASFTWLVPLGGNPTADATSWGWLPFGLLMGAVGMAGDLAESLLKRDAGCKDSSSWMPGFGGVLDILDSLLLTAPVAWLCWQLHLLGG
jgi:phosphatidate cytidylyltransferase